MKKLYQSIAEILTARANCRERLISAGTSEQKEGIERRVATWDNRLRRALELMPSGSGFDSGTELCNADMSVNTIRFTTAFHHMDSNGYYFVWTHYTVTVIPTFSGIDVRAEMDEADKIMIGKYYSPIEDDEDDEGRLIFDIEHEESFVADTFYQALTVDAPAFTAND